MLLRFAFLAVGAGVLALACTSNPTTEPIVDAGGSLPDAGLIDAAPDAFDASFAPEPCGGHSAFAPTWKRPAPFAQSACSPAQVQALVHCAFDPNADTPTCDALEADGANAACLACLFTPDTAKALGPIVIVGQIGSLNVAGCIANADGDTSANGCGAKFQAASDCTVVACEDNMPCVDAPSASDVEQCRKDARTTTCASYATAADACSAPLLATDGGAHECAVGDASTFVADAIRLGTLFCVGAADAGSDG